jgi:hypothetical protein
MQFQVNTTNFNKKRYDEVVIKNYIKIFPARAHWEEK